MNDMTQPASPENWWHNAVLGYGVEDNGSLAEAFRYAADLVATDWLTGGSRHDLHYVVMAYNYRHALELALKYAIEQAVTLTNAGLPKDLNKSHSLQMLTTWLKEQIEAIPEIIEDDEISNTWSTLQNLHELDPSGQAFRYSQVKGADGKLEPARPEYGHVDIRAFATRCSAAVETIMSLGGYLNYIADFLPAAQEPW